MRRCPSASRCSVAWRAPARLSRPRIVVVESVRRFADQPAVEHQQRGRISDHARHLGRIADLGGRQDDRGRVVFEQGAQHRLLPLGRFAAAAEQGDVAGRGERLVDAGGELGEERIGQVVDDQRDARRLASTQAWRRRGCRHSPGAASRLRPAAGCRRGPAGCRATPATRSPGTPHRRRRYRSTSPCGAWPSNRLLLFPLGSIQAADRMLTRSC